MVNAQYVSSDDDGDAAPTLSPRAAKMKPFIDAIICAIEEGDTKTNNHRLVGEIKKVVDSARTIGDLKSAILGLPPSNASYGQGQTMNRVIKAL